MPSVNASRVDLLRWQFDLAWALFEYHLERLDEDDFLWEPGPLCWTVRPTAERAGGWVPDWSDKEPDPIPVPTIGWISWHIGWWWSVTLDHLEGRTPRDRTEITWPGSGEAAIAWLSELRAAWREKLGRLTDEDLDAPASFPWPDDAAHTVAHTLAWLNTELTKNVTEIGQLRLIRATQR
ncbi:DinB family protein [Streptomyces sp. PT12]|uniref:DinB family protein n=1 Tax=Streptomyces sp. PT12 TaxID=1510197 RepID=UPI00215B999A|nr:DinB family protein [Streptomyces sp. PT12]